MPAPGAPQSLVVPLAQPERLGAAGVGEVIAVVMRGKGDIKMGAAEKAVVYCALVIVGVLSIVGVLYKLFGDVGVAIFAFGLVLLRFGSL
jgi:small neutral amino acid transporter SnatA (MarC family)